MATLNQKDHEKIVCLSYLLNYLCQNEGRRVDTDAVICLILNDSLIECFIRSEYYNWRLQSFSLLFCNRRLSEKIVLASIKEEGIEKAWRLPVLMDLDDLEARFVYRRPLKCTINKQLYCRATALYVHCVNLLKHIYIYSLKAVWTT